MRGKLGFSAVLITVLVGAFAVASVLQPVKAAGPYYIKADGSISPSTPLISTADDITYTLTGNIVIDTHNDGIVVERDNIVIDGAGYTIQGPGRTYLDAEGILAQETNNITVRNVTITAFRTGIWFWSCPNCNIFWNNITNSYQGIHFNNYSNYTNVYENNVVNNDAGILLSYVWNSSIYGNNIVGHSLVGISIGSFSHNIDIYENNITGNYNGLGVGGSHNNIHNNNITNNDNRGITGSCSNYGIHENNVTANTGYGIYLLSSSSNNTIFDNEINANGGSGINLYSSSNENEIYGNHLADNNGNGVYLHGSSDYNKVFGNNVTGNKGSSFFISGCLGNEIYENYITSNDEGVYLSGALNTSIHGNMITENSYGIQLWDSSNYNDIYENNITNSLSYAVRLGQSSNNTFYHNYFTNNTNQVYVEPDHPNTWDDNYPSGGNYWSDYTDIDQHSGPYQNETGSDEIWDHPYTIDGNNQDNYPLIPEFPSILILPLFMIATLLATIALRKRRFSEFH
jgi:parallel beta-helix repeat protein